MTILRRLEYGTLDRRSRLTASRKNRRFLRRCDHQQRLERDDSVLEQVRAGHAVQHYETVRQRKDGTLVPISLTVSPIYDDAGVVIGASKIARDISEQLRGAAASRRLA